MNKTTQVVLASDDSIAIIFEAKISGEINQMITSLSKTIREQQYPGVIEVVPSYHIIQVYFDGLRCDYLGLIKWIESTIADMTEGSADSGTLVRIPVCYDSRLGLDMDYVCAEKGIDSETLIRLHSEPEYIVYMMGFTPGFPYLGGMNPQIAMPRKETPRLRITKGSVGIAGTQTGIYPVDSPGGWQIIGRTPLNLFDGEAESPFLLSAGNRLVFEPITYETYLELGGEACE